MKLKTVALLLLMSIFWIPAIAQAKDLEIQAGDVKLSKDEDGDIYVNTGNTRLRVPANRAYTNINSSQYYRRINGCSSRNVTRQEVTQVRRGGNTVIQTNVSTHQCN